MYMYGMFFMLVVVYIFWKDGYVWVDIFYWEVLLKYKVIVDLLGIFFFFVFMMIFIF